MMGINRLWRTRSLSLGVENCSDGKHPLEIGQRHRNGLRRQTDGRENVVYRLDGTANAGSGSANRRNVAPFSISGEDPSKTMNAMASIDIDITTAMTTDKLLAKKEIGRWTTSPRAHEDIDPRHDRHRNNTGQLTITVD
jgi:hypothetical protein